MPDRKQIKQRSNFTSQQLTTDEKRRFDRQLRLPNWNQEILKKSSVLILGVGGLGVEVAKNLAMVGVGHLVLVDMDTIEYSNLNRQVLFIGAPEGSSKAKIAAKKLREINPLIKITAYDGLLQDLPPKVYKNVDLYIAGLDNIEARQELNRRAVHNKKPLIESGTAAYNGHLYCIFPGENACLDCDPLREREQDALAACTLVGKPRKPEHTILKGKLAFEARHERSPDILNQDEVISVQEYANNLLEKYFPALSPYTVDQVIQLIDAHEPTVITINCVMAAMQSQEAVKILHHIHAKDEGSKLGTLNKNYIIYNGLTGKMYEIEKPINPACKMCGPNRSSLYRIKVNPSTSIFNAVKKVALKKEIPIDPNFPPTVFRIDSSQFGEYNVQRNFQEEKIQRHETLLVTGFEDGSQVYLQVNYK